MNPPNLILLTAQLRADDAEGALYVCQLALLNALAALKMCEIHVPVWKFAEVQTTEADCVGAVAVSREVA